MATARCARADRRDGRSDRRARAGRRGLRRGAARRRARCPAPAATLRRGVRVDQQPDQGVRAGRASVRLDPRIAGDLGAHPRDARRRSTAAGRIVAERLSLTAFEQIDRLRARARAILCRQPRCGPRDGAVAIRGSSGSSRPPARPRFRACSGVDDTSELVDRLIRDHDTIVVPGHFFQAPQHIRIAFGGKAEMVREAVARLDRRARALSVKFFWLNFHLPYACRHSGMCCTSGWPIPVEQARVAAIEETHRSQR